MVVTQKLNRFYFGQIIKSIRECETVLVEDLHFRFRPRQVSSMSLYQLIKALDLDYPNGENGKLSLTKIDNKTLCKHIEWCIKLIYDNQGKVEAVEKEWERIKQIKG